MGFSMDVSVATQENIVNVFLNFEIGKLDLDPNFFSGITHVLSYNRSACMTRGFDFAHSAFYAVSVIIKSCYLILSLLWVIKA